MRASTMLKGGLYLIVLLFNLFLIWVTLGWKVRKAGRAFERELVKSGIPKQAAKRLAKKYTSIKDDVMKQIWGSMRRLRQ